MPSINIPSETTDYSDPSNWLVNPGKFPPKDVDVLYLYPTAYFGPEDYCLVTDFLMRGGARKNRNDYASVYERTANLYMPYYRQTNVDFTLSMNVERQNEVMRELQLKDVESAFEYYISCCNDGRPFILAGHSQGAHLLTLLMERFAYRPDIMERLVAAYIIGYSVTREYLEANPHLKFAEGREDCGVVVSWNTESPGVTAPNPTLLPGAIAINPVNWSRDGAYAPAEESLGAWLYEKGEYFHRPHFADARVDVERGVVVCSTVDPENFRMTLPVFPVGVLHGCDYPFYYYDIMRNVADRAASYFRRNV